MDSIRYGNKEINFEIKRSKREKTVTIQLTPSGKVSVSAPEHLDEEKIRAIVRKRAKWIIDRLDSIERFNVSTDIKEFVSGETFVYLGRGYRLRVVRSGSWENGRCELIGRQLRVGISQKLNDGEQKELVKRNILAWYRERAEEKIRERVNYYSRQIGVKPRSVEVKDQKKRWGSCSNARVLRFNWKIVMAPISVTDYVVAHELCHLLFPHHSSQFWRKVGSTIPDYEKRRRRLKDFARGVDAFG